MKLQEDEPTGGMIPDWANLSVIHKNTLPARANFFLYNSEDAAIARDVGRAKLHSLSGTWRFHLSGSPLDAPDGFQLPSYDCTGWANISVPGMWQLQGFGRGPQYTNIQYPFPVDPPHPPINGNECGSYITKFHIPKYLRDSQVRLRFEGVDSGFHVWLNGHAVGYSQGARNPSEFDISDYVDLVGDNHLAVRVYQYTDGSYIEDQDQWWLSGIFRDVSILGFPKERRLEDFNVRTIFDANYENANLEVDLQISGKAEIIITLKDASQHVIAARTSVSDSKGSAKLSIPIEAPKKWTAEMPYLYNLVICIDGNAFTSHQVGFRHVEIKNGLLLVNGKRVVFKGANRHEHHPHLGRSVPYDFMKQDLITMKKHNLNAIRTCHQPSDPRLYDLADEIGLWVLDEADLECHGFALVGKPPANASDDNGAAQISFQDSWVSDAAKWTSDDPRWRDAYIDRAQQMVHRDKLHPSVIMWSLGNEAFYGRNHTAMADWIRSFDLTRPIHYEQDADAKDADVYSRMYASVNDIIEFGKDDKKTKPLVLCEFIHAMGTGPGNIKEYVDAFYKYPKLQGGWVWEWANHGLLTHSCDGKPFYGYGGDFGDVPNDYNFVMDGVLNSDHTPNSGLIEYKKAIEPVQLVSYTTDSFTVINRQDFADLSQFKCTWSISDESGSSEIDENEISLPSLGPSQPATINIPAINKSKLVGVALLDVSFRLKNTTAWAEEGHEVAFLQVPLADAARIRNGQKHGVTDPLHSIVSGSGLAISGRGVSWRIDLSQGALVSWQKDNDEVMRRPLDVSFYRAVTDNDATQDGKEWKEKFLHLAKTHTRATKWWAESNGNIVVEIDQVFAPPVLAWKIALKVVYTFYPGGTISLSVAGTPHGPGLPDTLPRVGISLGLAKELDEVTWFGRGPGENYKDMKFSQRLGLHKVSAVEDLWTNPDFPQECANRTDTHWLKLSSKRSAIDIQFVRPSSDEQRLFDFMASHYEVEDIDSAQHPYELNEKKQDYTILRLDADHHGLGTGSCGPKTLPEYALHPRPFHFEVLLS